MELQGHDFTLRPIDTLAITKRLRASGYTEAQAEVQAEIWAEIIERNLASKRDLKDIEVSLRKEMREIEASLKRDIAQLDLKIESVRAELKRDIKESEQRLTTKLGGMLVVGISIISVLIKLL